MRYKKFVRGKEKLILVILIALVVGAGLIVFNNLSYKNSVNTVNLEYSVESSDFLFIEPGKPALIDFEVESVEKIEHVDIKMGFRKINESEVEFYINDKFLQSTKEFVPGSIHSFSLDGEILAQNNTFKIASSKFIVLNSLTVNQYSFNRKVIYLLLNLLGVLIILGPFLIWKYHQFMKREELEDRFPVFLRDVVEGIKAGMSLPQAVKSTNDIKYGRLTPYIRKITAQLDWGISFEKTLMNFAQESHSKSIKRAINGIVQTYRSGGKISDVLGSIGDNLEEMKKLKKERKNELYGEVLTGYIVYIAFIVVLIGLMKYLIPALNVSGDIFMMENQGMSAKSFIYAYRTLFRNLIIIQSIFSGLVIGKLSEGKMSGGIKHVAILLLIGYTAAVLAI